MAGREGLVDTAVKTAETGYMQVTVSRVRVLSVCKDVDISHVHVEVTDQGKVQMLCIFNVNRVIYTVKYMAWSSPGGVEFVNETSASGTITCLY